jgi:hypothetical protein
MSEIEALAEKIKKLSPPDALRLAAGLLEQRKAKLAHQIAERVVLELGAALALRELADMKPPTPRGASDGD